MEISSDDLVNQINTEEENYDEYNQNNKIVNDIGYSYYIHHQKNSNNNSQNNNQATPINNQSQTIDPSRMINKRYNSQLSTIDENMENTLNMKRNNSPLANQNNYNNNDIKNNITIANGINLKNTSTLDAIRMGEIERKKILLDNIKSQITLRNKTKLEELKQRKEEDAQYLKDMIIMYPFGRGGGGAPIRDKSGKILTYRRNLISNPKYNQQPINVDDDYDEVWGKEKRIGRFYENESKNINNNINNNEEETIRPFSTNPQINTIKNSLNLDNYQNNNNQYENNNIRTLKNTYNYSNNRILNTPNNLNNFENLSHTSNLINYNNLLYKKILKRKKKELEYEKELEDLENDQLNNQYNIIQRNNIYNLRDTNRNKENNINIINRRKVYNVINEDINENENKNKNENENLPINKINKNDYYDNYNFVPKGQIHPRLENSFLFTDEINKLRNEIRVQQNALFDQITNLKDDAEKANNERNQVLKDLAFLKFQIHNINKEKQDKEEEANNMNNKNSYDRNGTPSRGNRGYDKNNNDIYSNKKDNYYYIDNSFFNRYENELPNKSSIETEKSILNSKKHYVDENQLELEELLKKSNDILENLKDNEKIENQYKKKPEDYFNTSDYFYHTYRLNHANDYREYDDNYNNYYLKNKYNNNFKNNKNDDDYEVKIEKI